MEWKQQLVAKEEELSTKEMEQQQQYRKDKNHRNRKIKNIRYCVEINVES